MKEANQLKDTALKFCPPATNDIVEWLLCLNYLLCYHVVAQAQAHRGWMQTNLDPGLHKAATNSDKNTVPKHMDRWGAMLMNIPLCAN